MKTLVFNGADLEAKDEHGRTALKCAIANGQHDNRDYLLELYEERKKVVEQEQAKKKEVERVKERKKRAAERLQRTKDQKRRELLKKTQQRKNKRKAGQNSQNAPNKKNCVTPAIDTSGLKIAWTVVEDAMLFQWQKDKLKKEDMAKYMPWRTALAITARLVRMPNGKTALKRAMQIQSSRYLDKEDALLLAMRQENLSYPRICNWMKWRSVSSLQQRVVKLRQEAPSSSLIVGRGRPRLKWGRCQMRGCGSGDVVTTGAHGTQPNLRYKFRCNTCNSTWMGLP